MAKQVSTKARLARSDSSRRTKKNAALSAWRDRNRDRYNAYIREWRARKRAEVASQKRPATTTRTTTVEIDQSKLASVRRVLGTRTLRETVDRSFDEVLARAARASAITRLQKMNGIDLDKPQVMAKAWR